MEERWTQEVVPVLSAAGAADIEGLDAKVTESRDLDAAIKAADTEIEALRAQIGALAGGSEELREASRQAKAARSALGETPLESLAKEIAKLGADPATGLRKRRAQLSKELEAARAIASQASTHLTLAGERARNAQSCWRRSPMGPFWRTRRGHAANPKWRRVATSGCNRVNERSALRAGIFKA